MNRRTIFGLVSAALVVILFWPWVDNPTHFVKWEDRLKTSLPIASAFGFPCHTYKDGVIVIDVGPECYRFSELRNYTGVWLNQFEGSTFIEGAKDLPVQRPPHEQSAWLEFTSSEKLPQLQFYPYDEALGCYPVAAYYVRFTGRERPGPGGHFGLSGKEIWAERVLEMRPLAKPSCQPD